MTNIDIILDTYGDDKYEMLTPEDTKAMNIMLDAAREDEAIRFAEWHGSVFRQLVKNCDGNKDEFKRLTNLTMKEKYHLYKKQNP